MSSFGPEAGSRVQVGQFQAGAEPPPPSHVRSSLVQTSPPPPFVISAHSDLFCLNDSNGQTRSSSHTVAHANTHTHSHTL